MIPTAPGGLLALGLLALAPTAGATAEEARLYVVDPARSLIRFHASSRSRPGPTPRDRGVSSPRVIQ